MRLVLNGIAARRGEWAILADGMFGPGTHLVSGAVGSGKSTLALLMAHLIAPATGSIDYDGITRVMLSFQSPEFQVTGFTIADECASWGAPADEILSSSCLETEPDRPVLSLSRGELRRLHLGCILHNRYDLLLLDEPFGSLDCCEKERLAARLSRDRLPGIVIIFTHEQQFLPDVDRIWEIQNGHLADLGEPPGAIGRWQHAPRLVKELAASGRLPENLSMKAVQEAACRTRGSA